MYSTHRIPGSPSSPATQRPPATRRASESGGGSENRLEVACSRGTRRFQRELSFRRNSFVCRLLEAARPARVGEDRPNTNSCMNWTLTARAQPKAQYNAHPKQPGAFVGLIRQPTRISDCAQFGLRPCLVAKFKIPNISHRMRILHA